MAAPTDINGTETLNLIPKAQEELGQLERTLRRSNLLEAADALAWLNARIGEADAFVLPDRGAVLTESGEDPPLADLLPMFRLPGKAVAAEFRQPEEPDTVDGLVVGQRPDRIALGFRLEPGDAWREQALYEPPEWADRGGVGIWPIHRTEADPDRGLPESVWGPAPWGLFLPDGAQPAPDGTIPMAPLAHPALLAAFSGLPPTEVTSNWDSLVRDCTQELVALVELGAVARCENVRLETVGAPAKLNAKRAGNGRPPIPNYAVPIPVAMETDRSNPTGSDMRYRLRGGRIQSNGSDGRVMWVPGP